MKGHNAVLSCVILEHFNSLEIIEKRSTFRG